jgi:hypothetical protein
MCLDETASFYQLPPNKTIVKKVQLMKIILRKLLNKGLEPKSINAKWARACLNNFWQYKKQNNCLNDDDLISLFTLKQL